MLLKRSLKKELMDDMSPDDNRIDSALNELKIINKYLGGNSVSRKGFKKIISNISVPGKIKILDAGGGASDNLLSIKGNNLKIFSVDMNKRITGYVKKNSPEIEIVCADIFNIPFKHKQFDLAHASLVLHHFNNNEIKNILTDLAAVSKYAIVINDLQRSVFAYWGIRILSMLFSKSEFVKHDAPLSVRKGFKKSELEDILNELKFRYEIKFCWAYRWLVVIYINHL